MSRAFPKQVELAHSISRDAARLALASKYRKLYPTAPPGQIARLFGWTERQATVALAL